MAIKKSELYSSIWQACDQLRGGMDASQYKDYVLVLLFMKYVSDKYGKDPDPVIVKPKGSVSGRGGSFEDMLFWKGKTEIGDQINKIIGWNLDINDGERINTCPFVKAELLRNNKKSILNILWDKDRGKDIPSVPWYHLDKGDRINNKHLSLQQKKYKV